MKALIYVFAALCLLFTSACEKSETRYTFGKPVKVLEGQTVKIAENSMLLTAVEINDYRCPKNAVCVWQGYASVKLELSSANDTLKNINLCTGGCSLTALDTVQTIELSNRSYTLRLNEIGEENGKEYASVTVSPK
jgi:hypothetical protein